MDNDFTPDDLRLILTFCEIGGLIIAALFDLKSAHGVAVAHKAVAALDGTVATMAGMQ